MGKRTCPIISVERVSDFGFNSPWPEYYVIKFKDGSTVELIEKPKLEYLNKNSNSRCLDEKIERLP